MRIHANLDNDLDFLVTKSLNLYRKNIFKKVPVTGKKTYLVPTYEGTEAFLKGKKQDLSVLRIRDVYPGSRILIFTHPGSKNR